MWWHIIDETPVKYNLNTSVSEIYKGFSVYKGFLVYIYTICRDKFFETLIFTILLKFEKARIGGHKK